MFSCRVGNGLTGFSHRNRGVAFQEFSEILAIVIHVDLFVFDGIADMRFDLNEIRF